MDRSKHSVLQNIQREFFESLSSDQEKNKKLLLQYLEKASSLNLVVPDIVSGDDDSQYSWFNIPPAKPCLSLRSDFRDKITIIDFFTYCCINCMHILPTLEYLEKKYGDSIGVIGVHSAKFDNEKVDENLAAAIERLTIKHPVVSDDMTIWRTMNVRCWPTVLVIGPGNKLVFVLTGEVYVNKYLDFIIEVALEYFESPALPTHEGEAKEALKITQPAKCLKFPSTVKYSPNGQLIAVADAGNNRIVIVDTVTRKVTEIIGSEVADLKDGPFNEAALNSPQGLDWISDDEIAIADTRNHSVRIAQLKERSLKTVADIRKLTKSPHSRYSPWDCAFWPPDKLLVSMAGSHQIWLMSLSSNGIDAQVCEGLDGLYSIAPFVGSGREENRNNTYRRRAGLAQPSGLFLDRKKLLLYFADSESSTVRVVDLNKGAAVCRLIGGAIDPMDLFAFGDTTGKDWEVKLQHPLGVAYSAKRNSVFVADTYNHKLKEIEVVKKMCYKVSIAFNEPAGLTVSPDENNLLVCNTNDHTLKMVDLDKLMGSDYAIDFHGRSNDGRECIKADPPLPASSEYFVDLAKPLNIKITFNTESDLKLNSNAPSCIVLKIDPSCGVTMNPCPAKVLINDLSSASEVEVQLSGTGTSDAVKLTAVATVYLCSDGEGLCFRQEKCIDFTVIGGREQVDRLTNEVHLYHKLRKE